MRQVYDINGDAWAEWVEYRHKEKRKKIGPIAERKQLEFLSQYPPAVQQEIINTSIQSSWQGLFAPKGGFHGQHQQAPAKPRSAVDRTREASERWAAARSDGAALDPDGGYLRAQVD